jgi:hypothetical protein
MIDDRFDHKSAEARLYEAWESSGAFKPSGEGAPNVIVGDDPPDQQGRSDWQFTSAAAIGNPDQAP